MIEAVLNSMSMECRCIKRDILAKSTDLHSVTGGQIGKLIKKIDVFACVNMHLYTMYTNASRKLISNSNSTCDKAKQKHAITTKARLHKY